MSFVTVSEGPATADDVDAMRQALEQAGVPKPLVHIAAPMEGGFRVINVWATQADVEVATRAAGEYLRSRGVPSSGPDAPLKRSINPVYRLEINGSDALSRQHSSE